MQVNKRYELHDLIGAGGMGKVYEATDRLTGDTVALKRVIAASRSKRSDSQLITLAQEFQILASLRHPHIIDVLDFGFDHEQTPYFTMTLLTNTEDILRAVRDTSVEQKITYLIQLFHGLGYLHRRGIIHRDIKPTNVMVTDGHVEIIDFGLAIDINRASNTSGTFTYMAPELLEDQIATIQSDFYGAGLIGYQLFTGNLPFDTNQSLMKMMQAIISQPVDLEPLPENMRAIIDVLLKKDPADRPQNAFEVIDMLNASTNQPYPRETVAIRNSFLEASTFVGRRDEMKQLQTGLKNLIKGQSSFYLIGGESGVGKSRLVDEFSAKALVAGAMVLQGQLLEDGGAAFGAWRPIVKQLVLSVEIDDLQAGILKSIVPDIDQLVGRTIKPAPELRDQAYQERLIFAIRDLVKATDEPHVLIIEDLQWAGTSLTVLENIQSMGHELPYTMIIGTYRDDEAPHLADTLSHMQPLQLPRLNESQVQELATSMLGTAGKDPHITEYLASETEGNTFFMVEIVRTLAEEAGSLDAILHGALPTDIFTGGMQALLQRRLAKLSDYDLDILDIAAIVGRNIDERIIMHIFDDLDMERWLQACQNAAILNVHNNLWRFTHDKLREGVLAKIDQRLQARLHQRVAETIEDLYPNNPEYDRPLYNHWCATDNFDKELFYAERFTKALIELSAQYDTAESIIESLLERMVDDDIRRIDLLLHYATALKIQGYLEQAIQKIEAAIKLAEQHQNLRYLAAGYHLLGDFQSNQGESEAAMINCRKSIDFAKQIDDQELLAEAYTTLGWLEANAGKFEDAKRHMFLARDMFEALQHQFGLVTVVGKLGVWAAWANDDHDMAKQYFLEGLEIAQSIGHLDGIAGMSTNLGVTAMLHQEYDNADTYFRDVLTYAIRTNSQQAYAVAALNLATVQILSDGDEILYFLVNALNVAYRSDFQHMVLEAVLLFAAVEVKTHHVDRAAQLINVVHYHSAFVEMLRVAYDLVFTQADKLGYRDAMDDAVKEKMDLNLDEIVKELFEEYQDYIDTDR